MSERKDPTPKVGMKVTEYWWSDAKVYDIVAITKSGKTLTLRRRKPVLVKAPVMVPGGFCAVVVEQAVWKTEEDPEGATVKARWSEKKQVWKTPYGTLAIDVDAYYYDYGF